MDWPPKDPDDTVRRSVDWSEIYPDTIASSTFTLSSGTVTFSDEQYSERETNTLVAGGTDGATQTIVNAITTVAGQILSKTISLLIGEGADISTNTALTKGDIVLRALRKIGITHYVFDIEAEEQIDALRELDAMMDELQKDLEDFGYRQPATEGLTQPSDAAGIERWMLNPVIANLAVRLAGDYGKTPAPNVMRQAATGRADVLIRYQKRVEVQMPSRMPVGAGNRLMGRFFRPVT